MGVVAGEGTSKTGGEISAAMGAAEVATGGNSAVEDPAAGGTSSARICGLVEEGASRRTGREGEATDMVAKLQEAVNVF